MGVMNNDPYMTDEEIAATYAGLNVTEGKLFSKYSGGLQVEFEGGAEEQWDNFVLYENDVLAFDRWYPEPVRAELEKRARALLAEWEEPRLVTLCVTVKVTDVLESQLQQLETCSRSIFKVNEVRCGTYVEDAIYYPAKED